MTHKIITLRGNLQKMVVLGLLGLLLLPFTIMAQTLKHLRTFNNVRPVTTSKALNYLGQIWLASLKEEIRPG